MNLYNLGTELWFGATGNADEYKIKGWHNPEADFSWIDGKSALLYIPFAIPLNSQSLTLNARFAALIGPTIKKQVVEIRINGKKAGEWSFNAVSPPEQELKIPANLLNNQNSIEINFNVPFAVSPKFMGISEDERVMGVALAWLKIS